MLAWYFVIYIAGLGPASDTAVQPFEFAAKAQCEEFSAQWQTNNPEWRDWATSSIVTGKQIGRAHV